MRHIYIILCVIGIILPYYQFVLFLMENGMDFMLFYQQLSANYISVFFGLDVIVSAVVLVAFIIAENLRKKVKYSWLAIVGTFTVGVSLGLPLFLYLRQLNEDNSIGK
ncbi:DUF2834 domain-containing protein [Candidatus Poribacteria bacterium]|nr:DUF2834 domain-containing protein [Candidatus Poribacteria bacterium]